MDILKRILGVIWLIMAVAASYFLITELGIKKISSGKQEDLVFGLIILFILTPFIGGGLGMFGYYSLTNEYSEEKK